MTEKNICRYCEDDFTGAGITANDGDVCPECDIETITHMNDELAKRARYGLANVEVMFADSAGAGEWFKGTGNYYFGGDDDPVGPYGSSYEAFEAADEAAGLDADVNRVNNHAESDRLRKELYPEAKHAVREFSERVLGFDFGMALNHAALEAQGALDWMATSDHHRNHEELMTAADTLIEAGQTMQQLVYRVQGAIDALEMKTYEEAGKPGHGMSRDPSQFNVSSDPEGDAFARALDRIQTLGFDLVSDGQPARAVAFMRMEDENKGEYLQVTWKPDTELAEDSPVRLQRWRGQEEDPAVSLRFDNLAACVAQIPQRLRDAGAPSEHLTN